MTLADLMEGLRRAAADKTKFCGVTLTQAEIGPILAEYDQILEELRAMHAQITRMNDRIRKLEDADQ